MCFLPFRLPMVAHNRYWSVNNSYDDEFNFIEGVVAIPQVREPGFFAIQCPAGEKESKRH